MERLPLHMPRRLRRGVFEKFLNGDVEISNERVEIEKSDLDPTGKLRLAECKGHIETVFGVARLKWKSCADREQCIAQQKSKIKRRKCGESRWTDVLAIIDAINRNDEIPLPALVHPNLHYHEGLRVIDGARRIVAQVETGREEFLVVVVRPICMGIATEARDKAENVIAG